MLRTSDLQATPAGAGCHPAAPGAGQSQYPLYFRGPAQGEPLRSFAYKGYTISPRTFQLRGSARWTLDLLIGRNGQLRAFGDASTYATEAGADTACNDFGCRIIDGSVRDCSVSDLR